MRKTNLWRVLSLLLAGALGVAAAAAAADLGKVIEERNDANAEAVKSQQRIDRLSDETEDLARQYRSVIDQIDSLKVYNGQLERLIADQESEMESLRRQIDQVQLVGREMTPLMLEMIDTLEKFVQLDIPFLPEERSRRLTGLRDLMGRSDVSDSER